MAHCGRNKCLLTLQDYCECDCSACERANEVILMNEDLYFAREEIQDILKYQE